MKMGKLCKWGKVVLAGFVLPVAMVTMEAASYAMETAGSPSPVRSLEEILNSPDIQLSEKAKVGGRVTVVENLEDYEGMKILIQPPLPLKPPVVKLLPVVKPLQQIKG